MTEFGIEEQSLGLEQYHTEEKDMLKVVGHLDWVSAA